MYVFSRILRKSRDYFMRKKPFQKMRYLQLPSIKCQTPQNLKVFKKKRKMEEQGFELLPPNPLCYPLYHGLRYANEVEIGNLS